MNDRHVFTIIEAADYTGLSVSTLERLIRQGKLRPERLGAGQKRCGKRLLRQADMDDYLDASREHSRAPAPGRPVISNGLAW